jgi:hypothetical protein
MLQKVDDSKSKVHTHTQSTQQKLEAVSKVFGSMELWYKWQ